MMIGLHDADLIYRNEKVHESEKMAHHMMVCYLNVDLNIFKKFPHFTHFLDNPFWKKCVI